MTGIILQKEKTADDVKKKKKTKRFVDRFLEAKPRQ